MSSSVQSFPFTRLPPELRNHVYALLFKSPLRVRIQWDIPYELLHDKLDREMEARIEGVSILRVSKQIHDEAAIILYCGDGRTFCFDDCPYREKWSGISVPVKGACPKCYFDWKQELKQSGTNLFDSINVEDDTYYNPKTNSCNHKSSLTPCGLLALPTWLISIGSANQLRISHLQLRFLDGEYTYCLADVPINYEYKQNVGGDYLMRGLQQFAINHKLQTFTLSLFHVPDGQAFKHLSALRNLFRPERGVGDMLAMIRGIGRLKLSICQGEVRDLELDGVEQIRFRKDIRIVGQEEIVQKTAEGFRDLKAIMESHDD